MGAVCIVGEVDLAAVGAVLADRARARVLLALADGRSLSASVLASEAGVAPSTASHHLTKLVDSGFLSVSRRGRHRYFTLAGPRIAELIEAAARVAPRQPIRSLRQGTRAHALRYARRCYDHLAGRVGIALTDALCEQGFLDDSGWASADRKSAAREFAGFTVTASGADSLAELGVLARPGEVARGCLDWSEQRHHVAGPLGRAILAHLLELGWLRQDAHTRAMRLTENGKHGLPAHFGIELPVD